MLCASVIDKAEVGEGKQLAGEGWPHTLDCGSAPCSSQGVFPQGQQGRWDVMGQGAAWPVGGMSWEQGSCWGPCAVSASEGPCSLLKCSALTGVTSGPQQASPMSLRGRRSRLTWATWGEGQPPGPPPNPNLSLPSPNR